MLEISTQLDMSDWVFSSENTLQLFGGLQTLIRVLLCLQLFLLGQSSLPATVDS